MRIRTLVVDDEPIARRSVVRLLREDPEVELLAECGDGETAVRSIRHHAPDLVFLDMQMPALTGLEVVAKVGAERMPVTVFVTAFENYAVRAFEANAIDYLVKPFSRERFHTTLQRVKARLLPAAQAGDVTGEMVRLLSDLQQRDQYLDRVAVRVGEQMIFIDVTQIVWIKADGNHAQLHLADRVYDLRETMTHLAAKLNPKHFTRVHRSAIVNLQRIRTIQPWFNGYHVLVMDTGAQLRMSRYQHQSFLKLVGRS